MTPPTTTRMSARPSCFSAAITSGTSVLWPPARVETPSTCTSFSTAMRAASLRRLEQRTDVDVEAEIGKRRGDHLGTAIVPVLSQLGHEDARTPALVGGKPLGHLPRLLELRILLALRGVHAGDGTTDGLVAPEHRLQRVGNLARAWPAPAPRRRPGPAGCRRWRSAAWVSARSDALHRRGIASALHLRKPPHLRRAHGAVVHLEHLDRRRRARAGTC